jgi:putative ABC transport system permease protein
VSLEAIEAIHVDWQGGAKQPGVSISAEKARQMDLTPKAITAFLVGLDSKIATFRMQRYINEYRDEPLLAVLPGVALTELWDVIGIAEKALLVVSACVVVVGLFGMLTALLISLNERRREMAILRSVGARPWQIFTLILGEAVSLSLLGIGLGLGLMYGLLIVGQGAMETRFGLHMGLSWPSLRELSLLGAVLAASVMAGLIPAYRAYRSTLSDGLSMRV